MISSQLMMHSSNSSREANFDDLYFQIISNTVGMIGKDASKLSEERNERTGEICHTLTAGMGFSFDLSDRLPMPMMRKFFPKTAAAEAAWFIRADQDSTWIKKYCPIWDDFTEADGKTIKAAYGYRWRKHFGRDQLADLVSALFVNPSDRRTVLCAWDPGDDGLMNHGTKNVPCPFAITFNIVGGKLMLSYFIRSSDLFVGLPYDVMCTALVADAIAAELRQKAVATMCANKPVGIIPDKDMERLSMLATLGLGAMSTFMANPHMYDNHVDLAKEALRHQRDETVHYAEAEKVHGNMRFPKLPGWSITQIEENPDAYVELVSNLFKDCVKSTNLQRPDVAV